MNHKLVVTASLAAFVGLAAVQPASAELSGNKTMYLTFSAPVSLPGVALGTGTYIFEQASPQGPASDVVIVLSRDRRRVYFQGSTSAVDRPEGMRPGQSISLGEPAAGGPSPIKAWYPDGMRVGHAFIWRNR